jgi:transketolase
MLTTSTDLDSLSVKTIQFLSADAVEKAKSGHPGAPMGCADMAYVLWSRYLRFDPGDPQWPNRDRFILSNGHASMLLYSLLHLFEFDMPMSEIMRFRQWGSRTAGHPERGEAPGIEATTGPLGQGFGNGVGMALAQRMMQARLRRHAHLLDHRVFGIVSDGDLMEGISSEAASLAGHWGLGNLVYLYDDNRVSIEGPTPLAFCEDVGRRFEAYGWGVEVVNGNDRDQVDAALFRAVADEMRPSLLIARTIIAKGAPTKQGTAKAHGEPLGAEELRRTKEAAGWPLDPPFLVPEEVRAHFHALTEEKRKGRAEWQTRYEAFRREDPQAARLWDAYFTRSVPDDLEGILAAAIPAEPAATRAHSGAVIQAAAQVVPSLVGGAADLDPSTMTSIHGGGDVAPAGLTCGAPVNYAGRTLHFGVREHAMGSIGNGISLYGTFIPYMGTFLIFSDYMRPAIRLAALMKLRAIYVFTHDSVFLGEDGPTHQPIEQLPSLRLIPNLEVWRPADGLETAMAWARAIRRDEAPTALILTRQKLSPVPRRDGFDRGEILRGGYVLEDSEGSSDLVIVATGSEVPLAVAARGRLDAAGIRARVVSMPCVEAFRAEPRLYRDSVIPPRARRVVIEAARTEPWCEFLGEDCLRIGLSRFGASAPAGVIAEHLGFTPEAVVETIQRWLGHV